VPRISSDIVIVLDAIDECVDTASTSKADLIVKISEANCALSSTQRFRFVHTSRPSTKIGKLFRDHNVGASVARVAGETGEAEHQITEEIDMVIRAKVQGFCKLRSDIGIKDDVEDSLFVALLKAKNRTYLWVSLIFSELEDHADEPKITLLKIIREIPQTVGKAYDRILSKSKRP
jgi:hypothetical protein